MEFIARLHDRDTLSELRHRLRCKGIPTHVVDMESRSMGWQAALFVCLPAQAEDARRLIKDPCHEPAMKVDAEAFERALDSPDSRPVAKWITLIAVAVVLWFVALVATVNALSGRAGTGTAAPPAATGGAWR